MTAKDLLVFWPVLAAAAVVALLIWRYRNDWSLGPRIHTVSRSGDDVAATTVASTTNTSQGHCTAEGTDSCADGGAHGGD